MKTITISGYTNYDIYMGTMLASGWSWETANKLWKLEHRSIQYLDQAPFNLDIELSPEVLPNQFNQAAESRNAVVIGNF
jgi:hypothetical protein